MNSHDDDDDDDDDNDDYLSLTSDSNVICIKSIAKFLFCLLGESVVRVVQFGFRERFWHPSIHLTAYTHTSRKRHTHKSAKTHAGNDF